jgi:tetratricopeptide (TPR) repeat protein
MGGDVVAVMRESLLDGEEILEALPQNPEVLVALLRPFVEDGQERAYLDAVDECLARGGDVTWRLLLAYGNVCLQVGEGERLRERMNTLGPLPDPESESERLHQRSRAHLSLGDGPRALDDARQARNRSRSPRHAEHLGDVLLSRGSASDAVLAFRDSLGIVASGTGSVETRARLYRKIGEAEEKQGRVEKAYDAYRLALQLDPEEPYAKRRMSEMKEAAGVQPAG